LDDDYTSSNMTLLNDPNRFYDSIHNISHLIFIQLMRYILVTMQT